MRPTWGIGHMFSRFLYALAALFFTEIRDAARVEVLQYLTRCLVMAGMGLPLYSPCSRGFSLT